jgi:hypothetical protein
LSHFLFFFPRPFRPSMAWFHGPKPTGPAEAKRRRPGRRVFSVFTSTLGMSYSHGTMIGKL